MKIVIAGGNHEADFIIKALKEEAHEIVVINNELKVANYLARNNNISVFPGDPTKSYCLSDANCYNFDVLLALSESDTDNYITCITAKKMFNIKKVIAKVKNPKNVDLFKNLGVDSVISSTYLLAQSILNESSFEKVLKTLSIEDEKIILIELGIEPDFLIVDEKIMDLKFPKNINISAIFRDPHVIIPTGSTVIKAYDRIILITTPLEQKEVLEFLQKRHK